MDFIRHGLTLLGVAAASPFAFFTVVIYAFGWAYFEPETFDWHAVAVLSTWIMTLFIQRAAHRDTQAVHAKLDEILRNDPKARTELEHLDEMEPEEIEHHRHRAQD